MAVSSSGIVAGLTAAALATVGYLAHQASQTVPAGLGRPQPGVSPAVGPSKAPQVRTDPTALPSGSGTGARVVYSLRADRVWLVAADEAVSRTFKVYPSQVDPAPGSYTVTSRSNTITGSDGVPVEHVVRFTSVDGVVIGWAGAYGRHPRVARGRRRDVDVRDDRPQGRGRRLAERLRGLAVVLGRRNGYAASRWSSAGSERSGSGARGGVEISTAASPAASSSRMDTPAPANGSGCPLLCMADMDAS